MGDRRLGGFPEHDRSRLRNVFLEAGGDVDGVTEDRVIDTGRRPDVTYHDRSRVHRHPNLDAIEAFGFALAVPDVQGLQQFDGRTHGALGVILLRQRRTEERHDGIADEFIERAAVFENDIRSDRKELIEKCRHVLRRQAFTASGKADDVGKKDRRLGQSHRLAIGPGVRQHDFDDRRRVIALETVPGLSFFSDPIIQTRPFDGHRRVVGKRRQQIEIGCRKRTDMHWRIHVDDADHQFSVPQGRTHGGADLVDANAAPGLKTLICLRVVGQDGHLLLRHHVENGARDGHLVLSVRLRVAGPIEFEFWFPAVIKEDDEPPVHHEMVEDQIHDLFEHWFQFLDLDQDLGHLSEDLEHTFTRPHLL